MADFTTGSRAKENLLSLSWTDAQWRSKQMNACRKKHIRPDRETICIQHN